MITRHTILTELYHPPSWTAPEGGPEIEILFECHDIAGSPALLEFVQAVYTHDVSIVMGSDRERAEDWLFDHEDEAFEVAQMDRTTEHELAE